MVKPYSIEDISIVIPTYNRSEELAKTLQAIKENAQKVREVVIVDQSANDLSKKIVTRFKQPKFKYVHTPIPSITRARNLGVKNSSEKSKIICFIDDDVTLKPSYFTEIIKVFNQYPQAKAAAGYVPYEEGMPQPSKVEQLARKLFFLGGRLYKDDAKIVSAYGNRYPLSISGIINAHWMPGDNMVYKKELFKERKFDDNLLGYTVAEDIDFGYWVSHHYPNSVFITPHAELIHRYSYKERAPTARISYINQVDHFYFYFKNLNKTLSEKLIFMWSMIGIIGMRVAFLFAKPNKNNFLKTKYFFLSLGYTLRNLQDIRKGNVRAFEKQLGIK